MLKSIQLRNLDKLKNKLNSTHYNLHKKRTNLSAKTNCNPNTKKFSSEKNILITVFEKNQFHTVWQE